MNNREILIDLWRQAGQTIDEQRLKIFALLSQLEQQKLLDQIKAELREPFIV